MDYPFNIYNNLKEQNFSLDSKKIYYSILCTEFAMSISLSLLNPDHNFPIIFIKQNDAVTNNLHQNAKANDTKGMIVI